MATFAARRLQSMVRNTAFILSIEWLAAAQGIEFLRPLQSSVALEKAMRILREQVSFMDQDRWLSPDIEAANTLVHSGQLSELLPSFHLVEKIH
jgi:histidine ammonia-lyase